MNARLDPIIERFRFSHHNLALMFAMGMTVGEVSKRTGFTRRRLLILLDDPTFNELIAHYQNHYRDKALEALPSAIDDMEYLRVASVRKLIDMYEESDETGEPIPPNILLKVHGEMADRTGYSKHTMKTVVNIDFATALDRAIERSDKERIGLIEGEILPTGSQVEQGSVVVTLPRTYRRA